MELGEVISEPVGNNFYHKEFKQRKRPLR